MNSNDRWWILNWFVLLAHIFFVFSGISSQVSKSSLFLSIGLSLIDCGQTRAREEKKRVKGAIDSNQICERQDGVLIVLVLSFASAPCHFPLSLFLFWKQSLPLFSIYIRRRRTHKNSHSRSSLIDSFRYNFSLPPSSFSPNASRLAALEIDMLERQY